jgi:hypothetical protein
VKPTCVTTSALPAFTVAARCSKPSLKLNPRPDTQARTHPAGLCFAAKPLLLTAPVAS